MHRYKLATAACRDAWVQTEFINHLQTGPANADDREISTKAEIIQLQQEKQVGVVAV